MIFEPIAIVGRACILPGALTPEALWQLVLSKSTGLSKATTASWRIDPKKILTQHATQTTDRAWTDTCGLIEGFEAVFNPEGYGIPADFIKKLDPLHQWLLHAGREALHDANISSFVSPLQAGIVIGNLSYPTASLSQYAESVWMSQQSPDLIGQKRFAELMQERPHAINRFMSGRPVQLLAKALNIHGHSFALDAACASSLYAIKLACDALQDGQADLMLAGGVNATDSLFLQVGFTALNALSKSGQSRPLHRDADGLIPAHGAGIVVLKRLKDAIKNKDTIHGVIRGVGLSNDGNNRGFLAPAESGQIAAMRAAYEQSGIDPKHVSWIECHATGTEVGDSTEIRSMTSLFKNHSPVISALKANIGHTITASSVAAVINILSGMEAKKLPPTRAATDAPMECVTQSSFELLKEAKSWKPIDKHYIAAINSFGFGGNNAHLLMEAYHSAEHYKTPVFQQPAASSEKIVITAMNVINASAKNIEEWRDALFAKKSLLHPSEGGYIDTVPLDIKKTPFPPNTLRHTLGQQLTVLSAVQQLLENNKLLDLEHTGILIGMQCDAEVARRSLIWRLPALLPDLDKDTATQFIQSVFPIVDSATVLGAMPNIVANRLNVMLDCKAPSFTVSAEEASGTIGLSLAMRELRQKKINAALVGAVDMNCEIVHQTAAKRVLPRHAHIPGDAAVVFLLKRLDDAVKEKDHIIAVISEEPLSDVDMVLSNNNDQLTQQSGHAHAASGLLHIAAAAIACEKGRSFEKEKIHSAAVHVYSFDELIHSFYLQAYQGNTHE